MSERVTVENALKLIPNCFEMVLCAAYRARELSRGHTPKVMSDHKPCVVALEEIAAGLVTKAILFKKVPT